MNRMRKYHPTSVSTLVCLLIFASGRVWAQDDQSRTVLLDDQIIELLENARKVLEYERRSLEMETQIDQIAGDSPAERNLEIYLNKEIEKAELNAQLELLNISYGFEAVADYLLEEKILEAQGFSQASHSKYTR